MTTDSTLADQLSRALGQRDAERRAHWCSDLAHVHRDQGFSRAEALAMAELGVERLDYGDDGVPEFGGQRGPAAVAALADALAQSHYDPVAAGKAMAKQQKAPGGDAGLAFR